MQKGKPHVKLYRKAAEVAFAQGVTELPISLSYTHSEAVACALALTADSDLRTQKKVNPTEELTRQFKEARQMLDEINPESKKPIIQTSLFDNQSLNDSRE